MPLSSLSQRRMGAANDGCLDVLEWMTGGMPAVRKGVQATYQKKDD